MKVFTYSQYIEYIHTLRLNAVFQLAEKSEGYSLYSHDKLIKKTLKNKEEVAKFINNYLEPRRQIEAKNLELYTNSYVTKKFKTKEADIVYKLKNKEIFFLIEHQSTIDSNMPFRLLNYSIDIMQQWCRNKKAGQKKYYPIIVPTVIYTGNQKWQLPKNFREKQIGNYVFENYKIDLEYNFVDINKTSNSFLLEQDTMFGYMMFLEKARNKKEMIEHLNTIIGLCKNKEMLGEIIDIINYLLENVIQDETKEELIEKILKKVGDDEMSTLRERLLAENRSLINQGKKEGILFEKKQIVKNMLINNLEDSIIVKITNIKKKDLEEIKKDLAIAK